MLYPKGVKTIPSNLKEYLTPLSLATWYLDNTEKLYISSNQGFDLNSENVYYISKILKDKYNINTSYKLESKGKIAFYVDNESLNNFKISFFVRLIVVKLCIPKELIELGFA